MSIYLDENPTGEENQLIINGVMDYGLHEVKNELPIKCSIALKDDGLLIGGAVCKAHVGQFYLDYLWVSDQYRNQGYGSTIHKSVASLAKNHNASSIWVNTLNSKAVSFYKNLGYVEQGRICNYVKGFNLYYLQLKF